MALEELKASLRESSIVKRGDYDYIVNPITDGIPMVKPSIIKEVVDAMCQISDLDCDYFITVEALGLPLATALSLKTGKPFNVVRKRMYGLPDEINISRLTGYSKSSLFVNGVKAGDKVIIVDDVVSTGGTLWALVEALVKVGVRIADILVVVEKTDKKAEIERKIGIPVKTLVKVDIVGGKVVTL